VPDRIFADARLVAHYDAIEGARPDLDHYLALVDELGARSVLDVGCGTGTFACLLAEHGVNTIGLDPALASLEVARAKPGADRVRWLHGDAASLPRLVDGLEDPLLVDLATMTGNVAQVFVSDDEWLTALRAVHQVVRPGGHLVFETRDPAREAWREWTRERSSERLTLAGVDQWLDHWVHHWVDVTRVLDDQVTFRWTFCFDDGETLVSDSTLRFRSRDVGSAQLAAAGFAVVEVREAPDRPGQEHVFVARRPGPQEREAPRRPQSDF
jgi:SAM-dependent methyltransferase